MQTDAQMPLLSDALSRSGTIVVNPRCEIIGNRQERVAIFAGVPIARLPQGDREAEDLFIAQAVENGYAKPKELAAALGRPLRTVQRVHWRFEQSGISGLVAQKRGPKGPRLGEVREVAIRQWHQGGLTTSEMARRLGVNWRTVRSAQHRLGLLSPRRNVGTQQGTLDLLGDGGAATLVEESAGHELVANQTVAETEPRINLPLAANDTAGTLDVDPMNRSVDRMLAVCGQLDDAAPLFAPAQAVPRAGVLLALPLIVASGVLDEAAKAYGSIGPAFYGLRTILLVLLFLGLLRIKHPENVKEYSPPELGRLLGLDRAPEVKTIRRKLGRMAIDAATLDRFAGALVRRRADRASEALGFLYVDGHVRVYNGKHDLPKTHVARMRICLPATQDMWVNDADGAPLFFVTQEAHPGLVSALPKVLKEVRKLVGKKRRVTVVFDRGGWSPKLFEWMSAKARGFDVLTYRKNKVEPLSADQFTTYEVQLPGGKVTYELADTEIEVAKGFKMRQVTRKVDDHQTHIVTTRRDLPVTEVAIRMFARWRQENFFKYMREEFAIDALVEYGTEAADAKRLVPNPARKIIEKELSKAKTDVARLEAAYGAAALENQEVKRPTMRGSKIANGTDLGIPLREAHARVAELTQRRGAQPVKVPIGQFKDSVVRLRTLRKRLSDALKMLAYQVETDIVRVVAPHYKRSLDEGRRLVRSAFMSSADIEPTADELRITLAPQSSAHRTRAIAKLCELLNDTDTCFPGTTLRIRYAIHGSDCAT